MNKLVYLLPAIGVLAACSPQTYTQKQPVALGFKRTAPDITQSKTVETIEVRQQPLVGMMPKATAFKMTGDYADNVAITIGSNGQLTYFPAPSDISKSSVPTSLGNGWYLNNQGISANSVFTKYTFEEYSKLPSVPSPQELKEAIIPDARVEDMIQLPYNINEAKNNIEEIKDYIKSL